MTGFLTAAEAAERLGIRKETLYAYVSRGLVASMQSQDGRSRLYRLADIENLEQRKDQRRRPGKVLQEALSFGAPLLDSSLTLIEGGRCFYRGHDVVSLSRQRTLEEVAALLWLPPEDGSTQDPAASADELFEPVGPLPAEALMVLDTRPRPWALETLQMVVPLLGIHESRGWAGGPASETARAGARLLRRLYRSATYPRAAEADESRERRPRLAEILATAWAPGQRDAASLIDAALVLCADHELNVSSFTARCVASAGSPIYSAVSAGLAALQGSRHGGHTRRVEALLREAGDPEGIHEAVEDRLRRGEPVPGFGQPLYPDGDPRFVELKNRIRQSFPKSEALEWAEALEGAGRDLLAEFPTVDVGLALTARALALPRDSALTLFALGRCVGWIGHALEQYAADRLIRPRARYTGPAPV